MVHDYALNSYNLPCVILIRYLLVKGYCYEGICENEMKNKTSKIKYEIIFIIIVVQMFYKSTIWMGCVLSFIKPLIGFFRIKFCFASREKACIKRLITFRLLIITPHYPPSSFSSFSGIFIQVIICFSYVTRNMQ